MTRRLVFGLMLAAAVACAGIWPFGKKEKAAKPEGAKATQSAAPKQGFDTQYTGGTIAAIPLYSSGKLDLTDRQNLNFHYGKPTWSVPYAKISKIEVADKGVNQLMHIPGLMKKKRVFTIAFENEKGAKQSVVMEMGQETALEALPLLEERSGKSAVIAGALAEGEWWGDRYWKTNTNNGSWDARGSMAQKD